MDADWTDAQIIDASQVDPEYFGFIFDRHAHSLTRYLVNRVGSHDAEALLGEAFRVAFEGRDRFDPGRLDARPWLFGIASNLVLKHLRTQRRFGRATLRLASQTGEAVASFEDRTIQQLHVVELWELVAEAIGELPERDREVVHLYALGGLDYAEIARALDIPIGTVRSRLHRVRQTMREIARASEDEGHFERSEDRS